MENFNKNKFIYYNRKNKIVLLFALLISFSTTSKLFSAVNITVITQQNHPPIEVDRIITEVYSITREVIENVAEAGAAAGEALGRSVGGVVGGAVGRAVGAIVSGTAASVLFGTAAVGVFYVVLPHSTALTFCTACSIACSTLFGIKLGYEQI